MRKQKELGLGERIDTRTYLLSIGEILDQSGIHMQRIERQIADQLDLDWDKNLGLVDLDRQSLERPVVVKIPEEVSEVRILSLAQSEYRWADGEDLEDIDE